MLQGGAQAPKNDDCAHGQVLPKKFGEIPAAQAQRHGKIQKSDSRKPKFTAAVDDRGLNQDQNLFTTMNAVDHPFKNSVVSFRNRSS
jgi:hypothetical protein